MFLWNAVTALSQLKLFAYAYFLYDNTNLPYAAATTWLYYVCLSLYYVLQPFVHVIQSCYNCIVTLPHPKFTSDHAQLLSDSTTFVFGWVHFSFRFVKKTCEGCFSFHTIFNSYSFVYFSFVYFFSFTLFIGMPFIGILSLCIVFIRSLRSCSLRWLSWLIKNWVLWTDFLHNLVILIKQCKIPHKKVKQISFVFEKPSCLSEKLKTLTSSNYRTV